MDDNRRGEDKDDLLGKLVIIFGIYYILEMEV